MPSFKIKSLSIVISGLFAFHPLAQAISLTTTDLTGSKPKWYEIEASLQQHSGSTLYRIGGSVHHKDAGSLVTNWPLSELEWDVKGRSLELGVAAALSEWGILKAYYSKYMGEESGQMRDSDWIDSDNPQKLSIYSESKNEMKSYGLGFSYLYPVYKTPRHGLALGPSYWERHYSFVASDGTQWEYFREQDTSFSFIGPAVSYEQSVKAVGLMMSYQYHWSQNWRLTFSSSYSPYLRGKDRDDHILRNILAQGEYKGSAVEASVALDGLPFWGLNPRVKLGVQTFEAKGEQVNTINGEYSHRTQAQIEGQVWTVSLAIVF